MFGLQPWHLIAIFTVALIIFGPSRLPELGSAVGRSIREFREAASSVQDELKNSLDEQPMSEAHSANSHENPSSQTDGPPKL